MTLDDLKKLADDGLITDVTLFQAIEDGTLDPADLDENFLVDAGYITQVGALDVDSSETPENPGGDTGEGGGDGDDDNDDDDDDNKGEGGEDPGEEPGEEPGKDPEEPEEPEDDSKTFDTPEEVVNAIQKEGGKIKLTEDLKITSGKSLTITKETELNLNGNAIEVEVGGDYGDTVVLGNGVVATIKGGEIKQAGNADMNLGSANILLKTTAGGQLTLEDVVSEGVYPVYLNTDAGKITIKSGEYTSPYDKGVAVYVQKKGKVTIEGGFFTTNGHDSKYLLNLKDDVVAKSEDGEFEDARKYMEVFGGEFVDFNPAESDGEPKKPTNFVADDHVVGTYELEGRTVYVVAHKDSKPELSSKGVAITWPADEVEPVA